ncbi:type I restriction-modification system endonuclease [Tenacibaculum finnmarkense]|uniref:Type I restriction-modification system endonuclease n=1 Tax=Tenacibaculum finnmarkense genomovar finnmarkense TaxID=1458503 RepID=A0AAP1REL5_9FLAO|nr:type I restriction-modification system endonuclease [Tenacibaculum finnmarkense]MBE7652467.1 type I restriction-modification system endonuclease [Tenacibaculum finnmarkense genomovar finnmarkense]MBE7694723.1 type I restriction-modification system endonuclease [Tenacibaculum finnmarkense genomovar finnmarkense]MCD8427049.1 type I restriction-modification system endonuclease [Tenacibaculum finnmarkense genomovar finnmarkense]MCG8210298.1 type I restriction-modification system endonuclease [Te
MKTNFIFLKDNYIELFQLIVLAERNCYIDPSTTLSKLRILTEKLASILIDFEQLDEPFDKKQVSKLNVLANNSDTPSEIISIFHTIRKSGNKASHSGEGTQAEARYMLRQTFYLTKWFIEVYEDEEICSDYEIPQESWFIIENSRSIELEQQLAQLKDEVDSYKLKIIAQTQISEEAKKQRKERAFSKAKKTTETEAETRERIDKQLRDVGWECDTQTLNYKTCKTLPQKGRQIAISEWKCGTKWADYALFNGLELIGIVEAKKHIKNVMSDLGQAEKYSQLVTNNNNTTFVKHANSSNYKVPFIFATNGRPYLAQFKTASGIWFWDARNQKNRAKPLPNWFSPRDLIDKLNYDENKGVENLQKTGYDLLSDPNGLGLRTYQIEAIKAVEHKILTNTDDKRALLAMATGTGKTRTMIGMCYRLIKSKRFRRILFLVDRRMLGKQASDSFKEVHIEGLQTFAQIYDLQDLEDKASELDTKIHFATVQGMVQRIAYSDNPPSVGDYDCIVVDEAHRGYTLDKEMDEEEFILRNQQDFQSKYRMVLDYFDAYRIGLTATPALHTKDIFGDPVFMYSYRKAVVEGYLIDFEPPYVFQTSLSKDGIVWEKGDEVKIYDPEENQIKDIGITEDEIKVEITGFNRKVITESFNRVILNELISTYGILPENKDKTLIFAATNAHADTIVRLLYEEYEALGEDADKDAIVKITGEVYNREDLLRKFKNDQYPSIVVTVDLLTTGIDVPSISNLVFLRRVNSRILYDQMVGRATRRCDDIGKEVFKIYDCVGVSEIMAKEQVMKPVAPLVTKTFTHLVEELAIIEDEYSKEAKLDRIIAKIQRKISGFNEQQTAQFEILSGEPTARDFAQKLKAFDIENINESVENYTHLWEFLDREKGKAFNYATLFSDHQDTLEEVSRAYEKNLKPKDYLESFTEFINNNKNTITALNIVCTKPSTLTRKELKELRLILDTEGFNKNNLNTAYKEVTNTEIVADIISHIRTSALGENLVSHQERITNAVTKLKTAHNWNQIQLKWLDKIEAQLQKESIITLDDLNKPPFSIDGGLKRLDKVFKNETAQIINELNDYLYA